MFEVVWEEKVTIYFIICFLFTVKVIDLQEFTA